MREKEEKETARVEAFSDGVFAVAITLLALDIHVPQMDALPHGELGPALLALWPSLLAYVTSFGSILVMWLNHDRLFGHIQRKDHLLLLYNGLLLMVITLYPFPTALVAEYVAHPGANAKIAAAIFSAFSIATALFFNLLWHHAADGKRLLFETHDRGKVKQITDRFRFGPLLYGLAFGAAFYNAAVSIGLSLALVVFFALPERSAADSAGS
ncbi:MAG: TMEM175 family protein [Armatimonadota bacterium]|nr:TMEM175 family protein [Armatimonadota bacterium]